MYDHQTGDILVETTVIHWVDCQQTHKFTFLELPTHPVTRAGFMHLHVNVINEFP